MVRLVVVSLFALVGTTAPQKAGPKSTAVDLCRPAALKEFFCRVGCPDPPPTLIEPIQTDVTQLRRPRPSGMAILEIGVNLKGEVVSACVLRSLRSDFDVAAQRAWMKSRWKVPQQRRGDERGFIITVTACTPGQKCPAPSADRRIHTSRRDSALFTARAASIA